MGCSQSKIENEEAVTRCKDRKLLMKEAVSSRNAFAAAHSSYVMSLKNSGAALSDYAHGEVVNHPQFSSSGHASSAAAAAVNSAAASQPQFDSLPLPPPPLPNFSPAPPLQRATSMPEFKISELKRDSRPVGGTIVEEEDEDDDVELNHRSRSGVRRGGGGGDGLAPPPSMPVVMEERVPPPPPPMPENTDSQWDFFWSPPENMPGPGLNTADEIRVDKEEVEQNAFEERERLKRVGNGGGDDRGRRVVEKSSEAVSVEEGVVETPPLTPPPPMTPKKMEGRRGAKSVTNVNLLDEFSKIDDYFLKASESAHEVSKMLEATRLHYHSNFADNRGHIDHSARVMRVITWNRSFRGLPNNADDGKDDFDSEEHETHATVLDKLLAWEKKLYDEVKAGELMKYDYHRKVALLSKQKKRNPNSEALEKTKAAVSHLHTRYIVDMQSLDSTVSEINRLRDDQLYPKLVALVDEMATMWKTMRTNHESQSKISVILRSVEISQIPKETSEHHHERTIQLWAVVQEWHAQFEKLLINQREYIKFLNNWLKLNLIPIESSLKEKVSSPTRVQNPPIQSLLRAWHDYLEKLPDEVARSAIFNFAAVINTIMQHQEDEMKLKEKCEETRKELTKKTRQFEDWYTKYSHRKMPDEIDPERTEDNSTQTDEVVAERKSVVDALKKRLEDEEEAYQKQCLQVREKAWTSLKLRLPDLFRALSDFSLSCSEMYMNLRSISH